jgi:hypothetical protein
MHFLHIRRRGWGGADQQLGRRALRTAVQWRKISFGTRSPEGERAVERLLTVVRTQLHELNALVYLTAAIAAQRCGQRAVSFGRFTGAELLRLS